MSTATMTDFIPDGAVLNLRDNYSSPPYLLSDFQTGKSIIRVAVNGADVSRHCFAFDAAAGCAEVYKVLRRILAGQTGVVFRYTAPTGTDISSYAARTERAKSSRRRFTERSMFQFSSSILTAQSLTTRKARLTK